MRKVAAKDSFWVPAQWGGSYSTGRISVRFHGKKLEKIEEGGWIFAGNGKAFAGVRFLDHKWHWNKTREEAIPLGRFL